MKLNVCVCLCVLLLGICGPSGSTGAAPESAASLPPPAGRPVQFTQEIKPILEASCIKCHGRGKSKGGLALDTRDTLLKGGDSGPAVVPGRSAESYLIKLVSGLDPDNIMPQKGSKLKPEQIGLLRAWIDQGLPWDQAVNFGRVPPINLLPRRPELPSPPRFANSKNPVDLILQAYFKARQIRPAKPVSDRLFARRVYLDVIGLLPPPAELEEFLTDKRPDKRERLVRRLLTDHENFAAHWLTFWNDALRNDYKGTGYIDGGRKQITGWLYSALVTNMPYHRFVAELINPTPESEGFAKGIVWRGVVNASQRPEMQAAQNISQVFMGVNLKCASCHDSFINDWSLADAYGLASIYATNDLEMVQCDKPTGHVAKMKFIYPELGPVDATAPKPERLKRLAEIITQEKNGRLTRTIVNRLWARFMGRGLVEPVDDMESPAWNPDLLDWLASDLVENGYDLKKTMERILTSEAYQWPAVPAAEQKAKDYVFQGPTMRRLSAEQFFDALSYITGVWRTFPAPRIDFAAGRQREVIQSSPLDQPVEPKWIWKDAKAAQKTAPITVHFRKVVDLLEPPTSASAVVACDNSFKLYVNGKEVAASKDHTKPTLVDLRPHLAKGKNFIAISAVNDKAAPKDETADQSNPAGLVFYARVRHERPAEIKMARASAAPARSYSAEDGTAAIRHAPFPVETVMDFTTDASWFWSTEQADGWEKANFKAENWKPAVELGRLEMAPWNLEKAFLEVLSTTRLYGRVRASLANADPLMVALGRPNREQVITARASVATTLQALELTNGSTLTEQIKQGTEKLLENEPGPARELIMDIYERALSRKPSTEELRLAEELVGSPARKEGLEDLLWALAMLPEFQLIY